jgi:stearoyl-CoA desaturase (delta-9 desaturase)
VQEGRDVKTIMSYGKGTPNDWIERTLYTRYNFLGVDIMLIIDLVIFGWAGAVVWLVQILWIPFWAAGVVNGLGHWWGYRNGETREFSTNVVPVDFLVGGELLHNNHHLDPGSAKLSRKWWEFDLGWMYITVLKSVGLAKLRVQS